VGANADAVIANVLVTSNVTRSSVYQSDHSGPESPRMQGESALDAGVAVEQGSHNPWVVGSSPTRPTSPAVRRPTLAEHTIHDVTNPLGELRDLTSEITTWKNVCKQMVGDLSEIRYKSRSAGEQLRAEIAPLTTSTYAEAPRRPKAAGRLVDATVRSRSPLVDLPYVALILREDHAGRVVVHPMPVPG
jgi:hypothetical protein